MAAKKKAFCTITIPDMETAAVVCAQLHPSAGEILSDKDIRDVIFRGTCGGKRGYQAIAVSVEPKVHAIWRRIHTRLQESKASPSGKNPPWLKNKPPDELGGYKVVYHGKNGVSIGDVDVSLAQLELIVKTCKKGKADA